MVSKPTITTYLRGESLDVSGGKLKLADGSVIEMTDRMADVSILEQPGEHVVNVATDGVQSSFRILVVEKPEGIRAEYGMFLSQVELPQSSFGSFSWSDGEVLLNSLGENFYNAIFTPENTEDYSIRTNIPN